MSLVFDKFSRTRKIDWALDSLYTFGVFSFNIGNDGFFDGSTNLFFSESIAGNLRLAIIVTLFSCFFRFSDISAAVSCFL